MQRAFGVAVAALLILAACTSNFAKDHPDACSDAKVQQVKDAVAKGSDLKAAADKAGSDPQCLTADEQKQAQASFAAFQAASPTPAATTAAPTTAAPTTAAPSATATAAASPSPTETPAATTAAPTQTPTEAPTQAPRTPAPTPAPTPVPTPTPSPTPTPTPTPASGVPGGVPNATGPVPAGFTRYGGTVVDTSTGLPIKGVCVYSGPPAGCPIQGTPRTDATGWFAIDYPASVQFLWTFEHPSYQGLLSQSIQGGTSPTFRLTHK